MKAFEVIVMSLFLSPAFAGCNLSKFRWDCEVPLRPIATQPAKSMMFCGETYGYVSKADYKALARYQRANVRLSLTENNEFLDSPCLLGNESLDP